MRIDNDRDPSSYGTGHGCGTSGGDGRGYNNSRGDGIGYGNGYGYGDDRGNGLGAGRGYANGDGHGDYGKPWGALFAGDNMPAAVINSLTRMEL